MRVFIAEKPSVAKAIAEILGATNKKTVTLSAVVTM
nr:DNA topoisomerase III [Salmonella enterica subsp. enterica serovar Rissen]